MSSLSLVSINIEKSEHLDLVESFLRTRTPDIFCVQELCRGDVLRIAETFHDTPHIFLPMYRIFEEGISKEIGVGIFSRLPIRESFKHYYHGNEDIKDVDRTSAQTRSETQSYGVASCTVEKEGTSFTICTTHFTWTPDGKSDDFQRADVRGLIEVLSSVGEFVLCGDFNAPRGGEIFTAIATKYKDNIPATYTTSIDGSLHRAGTLPYMVDGLFSTPGYQVSHVELIPGVSDHCAIVATVSKK